MEQRFAAHRSAIEQGRESDADESIRRWYDDPESFAVEALGYKPFDAQQKAVFDALRQSKRVAARSGHSCGKTALAAALSVWWYLTRYPAVVLTTAPTARQVRHVLWREIRSAFARLRRSHPTGAEPRQTFVRPDGVSDDAAEAGEAEAVFLGFTADDPDRFQGYHSARLLIVLDEASGIAPPLWDAVNGIVTGADNRVLAIGNPTGAPGNPFRECFGRRASTWTGRGLDSRLSSWCSAEWLDTMRAEWGEDSPIWRVRVCGEFADVDSGGLISPAWVTAAVSRWGSAPTAGPIAAGVDVARFGADATAIAVIRGRRADPIRLSRGNDLMTTAGEVVRLIEDERIEPGCVAVDDTGLGGGVTDRLAEQGYGVAAFIAGAKSSDDTRWRNSRMEAWWLLRERLREGTIALPDDPDLAEELCAPSPKLYSDGSLLLEAKDDTSARLGRSPDRADALAMAAWVQADWARDPDEIVRERSHAAASMRRPGYGRSLSIARGRR